MVFKRTFTFSILVVMVTVAAFMAGYQVRATNSQNDNRFPIFDQAYGILSSQGLKEIPKAPALEYGMIRGMLQAYNDPFTIFVEPVQHELESNTLQGSFGGIGVEIRNDAEGNYLLYPNPDSPAQKAGVQEGDRLVAVDKLEVAPGTPLDVILSAIRGPVGEPVELTLARPPDYQSFLVQIRRAETPLPSVTWYPVPDEPRAGVVEINIIANSTVVEVRNAVQGLQGRGITYFVLDLRDNPGGLLTAGVDIARLFLEDGDVMVQKFRDRPEETFQVEHPGPFVDIPMVVLINGGTASAAEIISGALQAHRRALLIGTHSFGKDTIQLVYDLKDGSSLHVTAAQWYIPGIATPVGKNGLQPDIVVAPPETPGGPDVILQAAVQAILKK